MGESDSKDSLYPLPIDSFEKDRLNQQYIVKKDNYGWASAVPMSIDLTQARKIIDIASGSCVWILDLVNSPTIKSRLGTSSIDLYACDITSKLFPDPSTMEPLGIHIFEQDATKPFSEEMYGSFDIVHIALLFLCITEAGWKAVLDNCNKLLKPGGTLILDEFDPVLYTEVHPPPPEDSPTHHNLEESMRWDLWYRKANSFYTGFALSQNFMVDLSFRLQDMVKEAGFKVIDSERGIIPLGKACRHHKTRNGESLAEHEKFSIECMEYVFSNLALLAYNQGALQAVSKSRISTEEDVRILIGEIKAGFEEEGALITGRYCVSLKM